MVLLLLPAIAIILLAVAGHIPDMPAGRLGGREPHELTKVEDLEWR